MPARGAETSDGLCGCQPALVNSRLHRLDDLELRGRRLLAEPVDAALAGLARRIITGHVAVAVKSWRGRANIAFRRRHAERGHAAVRAIFAYFVFAAGVWLYAKALVVFCGAPIRRTLPIVGAGVTKPACSGAASRAWLAVDELVADALAAVFYAVIPGRAAAVARRVGVAMPRAKTLARWLGLKALVVTTAVAIRLARAALPAVALAGATGGNTGEVVKFRSVFTAKRSRRTGALVHRAPR